MKKLLLALVLTIVPAATAEQVKIAVIDMERAIVQSVDGKKAEAAFTARFEALRKDIEAKQKHIEDQQNKLKTQERLLSDTVKADIAKDVTRSQTELSRIQEDAQKELDTLRSDLMRPIAQVAETVVNNFAKEQGFTLVIDSSNPQNTSILFVSPNVDLTDAIIKLIDAELAKAATKKPGI